jgi:hypothetical protein
MAATGTSVIQKLVDEKAAKAAKKMEKKILKEIGKQPTTVDEWMRAKEKLPSMFTVTADGDLVSPPLGTGQELTIYLPPQTSTTIDEQKEFYRNRVAELAEPEETFAQAKRRLREVVQAYASGQVTAHDVLEANNEVHQAESILNSKMKGARYIQKKINMISRDLTLNVYDTMNNPQPVFIVEYTMFPWQMFWKEAPQGEQEALPIPAAAAAAPAPQAGGASAKDAQAARTGAIIAQRRRAMNGAH